MLHEGQLRIEGDADGELRFYDAAGALVGEPQPESGAGQMTQGGSCAAVDGARSRPQGGERRPMTQGGSWTGVDLSAQAGSVLRAMGARGGWHVDALCTLSGLPASAVSCALLELELGGRVRRTIHGIDPVA
ncbi:MAG: hypothetical protein HY744_02065 [Deltaproteobacteria bacterium]|nr:hypothetical protein [Deltaproteobacteria bacterium]